MNWSIYWRLADFLNDSSKSSAQASYLKPRKHSLKKRIEVCQHDVYKKRKKYGSARRRNGSRYCCPTWRVPALNPPDATNTCYQERKVTEPVKASTNYDGIFVRRTCHRVWLCNLCSVQETSSMLKIKWRAFLDSSPKRRCNALKCFGNWWLKQDCVCLRTVLITSAQAFGMVSWIS